ncbi:hypothetical protein HWC35_gp021 [Vibrio phage USC-1]|uniref:Uncharacterized protein n=2 Tax=Aphroditevirus USC1 TaxID=2846605 RepID=A0A514A2F7_9CAUD|nr:hypothetical protein HWC35_gp021 [Vibrio phage USC-1]QCW23101.1 hypothetical protein [Vibrio phage 5 TSL-2019]QDH47415.1 hypothetical protein [Vibrio phage USC-1]
MNWFKRFFKLKVAKKEIQRLWVLEQRIRDMETWLSAEPKLVRAAEWLKEKDNPKSISDFRTQFEAEFGCKRTVGSGEKQVPLNVVSEAKPTKYVKERPGTVVTQHQHHHYRDESVSHASTREDYNRTPEPTPVRDEPSPSCNNQSSMDSSYE